ncbi:MAG TPA: Na-translocating system protein MpsB [Turneriella sp.]|nr:Na-translocating system protein MpsB [Turneriella sp.]
MGIDLGGLARYLPTQGPIRNFIHHNTLAEFQKEGYTFHEALRAAADLYGTKTYFPPDEYIRLYGKKEITDVAIERVLKREKLPRETKTALFDLRNYRDESPSAFKQRGILWFLGERHGIHIDEMLNPVVVRIVANYLDQGVLSLRFADHANTFWQTLQAQLSTASLAGVHKKSRALIIENNADALVEELLIRFVPNEKYQAAFVLEVLLELSGWAGLTHQLEKNPTALFSARPITLLEFVALYLALLVGFTPNATLSIPEGYTPPALLSHEAPAENKSMQLRRLWHEAWELSHAMGMMAAMRDKSHRQKIRSSRAQDAKVQAFFCIDDRECSLRRLVEEFSFDIETFGTAGHFAIDAYYLGPHSTTPTKQCPGPVDALHVVRGTLKGKKKATALSQREMSFWHRYANHLYSGWLLSYAFSFLALGRLLVSVFFPRKNFATAAAIMNAEGHATLHYEKTKGTPEGYTVQEMAARVKSVLTEVGLIHSFAPLVVLVGHGSTSTNNPYFAAYNCGACSGHAGAVNARVFAAMANRSDVRALLKKDAILLDDDTFFIGALHDTARDEIHFFDTDLLPSRLKSHFEKTKQLFSVALEENARERSRRFAMVPLKISAKRAHNEAKLRTDMLFEPRPEYNHANNSMLVIGRRLVTENLFADRRLFLNSYNPFADAQGVVLEKIIAAAVPVCAGINLEYLFSRLDAEIFGAGSKLPQNIISLLGVAIGSEGDLRTGLPTQMTEIHDPLRLTVIIEQSESVVTKIFEKNTAFKELVFGGWIYLALYDASRGRYIIFEKNKFVPIDVSKVPVPIKQSSVEITHGTRENILPTRLMRAKA